MKTGDLLQWQNLIFIVPLLLAVLLLMLSSVMAMSGNGGDETDGDRGEGNGGIDEVSAPGEDSDPSSESENQESETQSGIGFAVLLGLDKAPASLVWNALILTFGLVGLIGNRLLPFHWSVAIAILSAFLGARITAEIAHRLLPKPETRVVSRNGLFGMTGRVLAPVSEKGGRIRVYDQHRTLHDEPCRVAPGKPEIAKGRQARVIDIDADGRLIVEETPGA